MKKRLFLGVWLVLTTTSVLAGGLMTNTNYHIAFDRMMARGSTFDVDAAYSNPAGAVFGRKGWQLSFNWQIPTQNRDINTTIPNFLGMGDFTHKYEGKASAPFVPGLFAVYNRERWALSAMIGIVGSGGYVKYDDGIPMLNIPIMKALYDQSPMLIPGQTYALDSKMKGKQYIFGGQVSFAYRFLDCLSASVGFRVTRYDGYNRGHVIATANDQIAAALGTSELVNLQLDCIQKGWGFTPIIGINFHKGPITVAARYEFRTKHNIPNDTKTLTIGKMGQTTDVVAMTEAMGTEATIAALSQAMGPGMAQNIAAYLPGTKTRYDMPSLLSIAIGCDFSKKVRGTLEYHFFDDKHAKMSNNRQEHLAHGTHEILLGAEWDINKTFTVSAGVQHTDYGLHDDFQMHTSFACDSWSVGFGGAANINKHVRINAGYFWTMYSDYKKEHTNYAGTGLKGTDTFSRTNGVFGIGIDYKF